VLTESPTTHDTLVGSCKDLALQELSFKREEVGEGLYRSRGVMSYHYETERGFEQGNVYGPGIDENGIEEAYSAVDRRGEP